MIQHITPPSFDADAAVTLQHAHETLDALAGWQLAAAGLLLDYIRHSPVDPDADDAPEIFYDEKVELPPVRDQAATREHLRATLDALTEWRVQAADDALTFLQNLDGWLTDPEDGTLSRAAVVGIARAERELREGKGVPWSEVRRGDV